MFSYFFLNYRFFGTLFFPHTLIVVYSLVNLVRLVKLIAMSLIIKFQEQKFLIGLILMVPVYSLESVWKKQPIIVSFFNLQMVTCILSVMYLSSLFIYWKSYNLEALLLILVVLEISRQFYKVLAYLPCIS